MMKALSSVTKMMAALLERTFSPWFMLFLLGMLTGWTGICIYRALSGGF